MNDRPTNPAEKRRMRRRHPSRSERRGTAAVEFAVVAPFMVLLILGIVEICRALEVSHMLTTAAREGARFGAMDKEGILQDGQSSNDKVIQDVKNYLAAAGLPVDDITVAIQSVPESESQTATTFVIDDPDNDLELFEVNVSIPFSSVSYIPSDYLTGTNLSGSAVFRNSRSKQVN